MPNPETTPQSRQTKQSILYLGPEGSHSQTALTSFVAQSLSEPEEYELIPIQSFDQIFAKLDTGEFDYAFVPVENTLGGDVVGTIGLLYSDKYTIINEIFMHIVHHLVINKLSSLDQINKVYAHPQAFAQCSDFLKTRSELEIVLVNSTSEGAMILQSGNNLNEATISSKFASQLYDLKIAVTNIGNKNSNITRFCLIKNKLPNEKTPQTNDQNQELKYSLNFHLPHVVGALSHVLNYLNERGANITKIQSRLIPDRPFHYEFLLEFVASRDFTLKGFKEIVVSYNLLGVYPIGNIINEE